MQANHGHWHEARNIKREITSIEKAARAYGQGVAFFPDLEILNALGHVRFYATCTR